MELTHPDLARPFAPHRLKIYVVLFSLWASYSLS